MDDSYFASLLDAKSLRCLCQKQEKNMFNHIAFMLSAVLMMLRATVDVYQLRVMVQNHTL